MMAFGESLAFIAFVLPAWAVLVAVGTLISQGGLNFWPIWVAGAIGAALGDWLSYWVGSKLGPAVAHMWPLSRHPYLIPRGERFVAKWGALAIFIGRFSGPLRAVVPLVAGIFAMPFWPLQIANFVSALAWVAMVLIGSGQAYDHATMIRAIKRALIKVSALSNRQSFPISVSNSANCGFQTAPFKPEAINLYLPRSVACKNLPARKACSIGLN